MSNAIIFPARMTDRVFLYGAGPYPKLGKPPALGKCPRSTLNDNSPYGDGDRRLAMPTHPPVFISTRPEEEGIKAGWWGDSP